MSNNRATTLDGANKIFSVIGVAIEQHPMGFYQATLDGKLIQAKSLTALCQELVKTLRGVE